ncbi:glycosyl transferase-like protein, partial [Dinothrombium tinctorium]
LVNQARESLWEEINQVLKQRNLPPLRKFRLKHISTNLNIYVHPKCLMEKYLKLCPLGDEWLGLDYSLREYDKNFELSTSFKSSNRKLIYLSMGSLGSSIVELMSRLVKILSKCKHKVIVSRGTLNNMYELADNMWEQKFLPQLSILPIVDMVITHGCNQTLVESLYFGKPLIVLPFFGDQFDNAQRVVEAKIGVKFNPFTVDEKELLDSIEYMLSDAEIVKRVKCISNEMRKSKSMDYVVQKIEKIAENPKIPTVK